jgi:CubicO group peptidase (beta-lactamase class C family)
MRLKNGSSVGSDLEPAVSTSGVTGASFAYWDGTTLHTAVAGVRNSVTGDPVTVDTLMHIGSITKVMNAVLLMQLVEEGKIALEDPVIKYLPELRLRDSEALKRITCAMLVNHTSGINGDWLPEYGPDQERIVDAIERCADLEQLHPPGEATSYCNIATVIAGYLTERLRGESWYTLVKTRIYEPLGMRYALVDPLEVPRFRCSIGDVVDFKSGQLVQTARPFLAPSFAPAGSTQMTTASDLVTFARALLNGEVGANGAPILSAAAVAHMMRPTAEFSHPAGWKMGLGWMILPGGLLNHGGGGRGVLSQLYAHPASGRAMALLTNSDRGGALHPTIVNPILESWTGIKAQALQRQKCSVDPGLYEGIYENNLMRIEIVAREGGALTLHQDANGQKMADLFDLSQSATATLHPLSEHLFEVEYATPRMPNGQIRFVGPNQSGHLQFLATGPRLMRRQGAT